MLVRVELIDVRIEDVERVGVPQRAHELALILADRVARKARRQPRRGSRIEIPADRVCALLLQDVRGRDDIADVLGHLLAVLVAHKTEHDAVLERRLVEQAGRHRHQRIEPAARLIDRFGNERGGIAALELLLVLEGIVPLRKRHGTGVEPAVDHDRFAFHDLTALRTDDLNLIDVRLVQLDIVRAVAAHCLELRTAADDVNVTAFAHPDGQRRAPIALARDTPVDDVLEEVAHAPFADRLRDPVDRLVEGDQLVLDRGHADEPAFAGVIDQRRIAAPAERIAVLKRQRGKEFAALLQRFQDRLVRVLYEHAVPRRAAAQMPGGVDKLQKRKVPNLTDAVVVLAECRRNVDDAGPVGQRDVIVRHHPITLLAAEVHGKVEQRLILGADKRFAREAIDDLSVLAQHGSNQRFRKDIRFAVFDGFHIHFMCVDAQRDVRGQRPRRGRPCKDRRAASVREIEARDARNFLDVVIALRNLVAR